MQSAELLKSFSPLRGRLTSKTKMRSVALRILFSIQFILG